MMFNFNFLKDAYNYEERKVSKSELENGLVISTCYVSDEDCYETAITKTNDEVIPVERYSTIELAKLGHEKWKEFCKDGIGKKVIKLFWSLDPSLNEEVTL